MSDWGKNLTAKDLRRPIDRRTHAKRCLIVCEGSKTEPNYFKGLRKSIRLTGLEVEVADNDLGSDPVSVVNKAKNLFMKSRKDDPFDAVFCVFDRDTHETYDRAVGMIRDLQCARAPKPFYSIDSDPCFEYWILLHYDCIRRPFLPEGRVSPCGHAERMIRSHCPEYEKGMTNLFDLLRPRLNTALSNASVANESARRDGRSNPSTRIPLLYEKIEEYYKGIRKILDGI